MKNKGRKFLGGFLAIAVGYLLLTGISAHLNKDANEAERKENRAWVATSRHWIDRQLCRWIGLCGVSHLKSAGWTWDNVDDKNPQPFQNASFWESGPEDPDSWDDEEWARREIPQYVFDHAPYVHLFSGEHFWPGDLGDHISHTRPALNYSEIEDFQHAINLTNLHELNDYAPGVHGRFVYMQSGENVEEWPSWLGGSKNIPNSPQIHRDQDEVVEWPGDDVEEDYAKTNHQQTLAQVDETRVNSDGVYWGLPTLTISENGRCGGRSGFTCEGSKFGQCCSIYGWCGKGDAYCGEACDPLRGQCNDPFEIRPHPHAELRKRNSAPPKDTAHKAPPAGRSSAPAILIVVPKEDGIVDAFWFFFYSFNLGQTVLNIRFGNHVGDWEHTLIRFQHGKPTAVFLSEHNFGDAYAWHALEKYVPDPVGEGTMIGTWSNGSAAPLARRPVVYSAVGSHAMYATPGLHPYILPWGMLHDQTDRGPLWDPALNSKSFLYSHANRTLRPSARNPRAPTSWFDYAGHWGDKYYALNDPRQYRFAGQYHYVNGPSGPKFKNLGRRHVCQGRGKCHIRNWASDADRARRLPVEEDIEEGGLPGGNMTDDSGA